MKKTIPFMLCVLAIASIASIAVLGNTQTAYAGIAGFSGAFDPSNWTEFTEGNGSVDTSGAPFKITVEGSDGSGLCDFIIILESSELLGTRNHENFNCVTDYTIPMPCAGTVSFEWNYITVDASEFDVPGFLVNGVFTPLDHVDEQLASDFQDVAVQQGDIFGFRVDATDDTSGIGFLEISDFITPICPIVGGNFLPIDSTVLVLAGLQTSAIWMLPVLTGVAGSAFGILYIKSRRN